MTSFALKMHLVSYFKVYSQKNNFPECHFPARRFPEIDVSGKDVSQKDVSRKKVHYDLGLFLP